MRRIKHILYFVCTWAVLQVSSEAVAQNSQIDSLLGLLKNDADDTDKVIHFNQLSWEYKNIADYDTALSYADKALQLSQKLNFKKGIASAYAAMGNVFELKSFYPKALEEYLKALKIDEEINNKQGIAKRLGNIGLVYADQGDNAKALDYYLKGLEISEQIGDRRGMARHLGNIGVVYYEQKDLDKALEYYLKALKMDEDVGYKKGVATNLGNIGLVYSDKALAVGLSAVTRDSLFDKALYYFFNTLKMRDESGTKLESANTLANIGCLYRDQKKYLEAFTYLYRALAISDSIGALDDVKSWYAELSSLYDSSDVLLADSMGGTLLSMEGMKLRSLYYYKRFISVRDTLFSEENKKQLVRKEMNYEFDKKEAAAKAVQEKQAAVEQAEKNKQRFILILVCCFALLVLMFAGFIFRSLRLTRKQKKLIEHQKHIVEEKQKEILDSIHYAKRIQTALLPTEKYIDKTLNRLKKNN